MGKRTERQDRVYVGFSSCRELYKVHRVATRRPRACNHYKARWWATPWTDYQADRDDVEERVN